LIIRNILQNPLNDSLRLLDLGTEQQNLVFFAPRTRTESGFPVGGGLVQTESDSNFRLTPGKFSRNLKI
jgi:hypothetical protein